MTIETYRAEQEWKSSASAKERMHRKGKTEKDRKRGTLRQNEQNRMARASWQGVSSKESFPWKTCNGKRNRSQWTGKGNQTVFAVDKKR